VKQSVFVYPLRNAQATNLETILNNIFSDTGTTGRTTGGRTTGGRTTGGRTTRGFTFGRTNQLSPEAAAAAGDLVGQVYVVADEDTNSLLIQTPTKHVDAVKKILAELDRPIRQVLIKVLIAEVTHDDSLDLGTEFSVLNLRLGASGSITANYGNPQDVGGVVTASLDTGLTAVFNALKRMGKLDVLSRPYILASDNQEANINVGQDVPYITNSRVTDTGQTINSISYRTLGIILGVTPHVNPEGLVIMDVSPEISSISDTTVPISEGLNAVVFNVRSAETRVAIADGQTIVIGGLMEDRINESLRKVPGLGDLPLLGPLFQKTVKEKVKTELLIFLTPRVAEIPEKLKAISDAEEKNSDAIQDAVESGAFQRHMQAMRGPTSQPAPTPGSAEMTPRGTPSSEPPAQGRGTGDEGSR